MAGLCLLLGNFTVLLNAQNDKPLRLGVAGVTHGHLNEVFIKMDRGDFEVVGVWEADDEYRENNRLRGKLDGSLFFADLEEMLDRTKPEAVVAYGSIYDHLAVVEACAPRGIHVMVEKPLAVNMKHADKMAKLSRKYGTMLLTNYETTWYPTNHEAYRLVNEENAIGKVHRIEVYDGHRGPVEIHCGPEFLEWLTDPALNGGGAVIDFGCYGANLATWLLKGEEPVSVYGVLKQHKPDVYPKVDDDATIIVEYPSATVQIMGSWIWPMNRKDMHIYGKDGYVYQDTSNSMRVFRDGGRQDTYEPARLEAPYNDSFLFLRAAVRKEIDVKPYDLSSLENNLMVVKILESAIKSSRTGRPVRW